MTTRLDDRPTCDICGLLIQNNSIDLWAFYSVFDEDGTCQKTGEQIDMDNDYLIIGEDCCGHLARALWADLARKVKDIHDINQASREQEEPL